MEYRKQDPEFQRMVEEEMRKLTQELSELEPEAFTEPVANAHEKKDIIYSPRRSYIPTVGTTDRSPKSARQLEREEYLKALTSKPGEETSFASMASDAHSAKREKQEIYAQQLRKQEEDAKQAYARENDRVSLYRQRMKPSSPIQQPIQENNFVSSIGKYELKRSSPEAKKKKQQEYAKQLLESQRAQAIPSTRVLRNKPQFYDEDQRLMSGDSLDPMLKGSQTQSQVLGTVHGVYNSRPGDGNIDIGSNKTDDQIAFERRRKQAEYMEQLNQQKQLDYEAAMKKYHDQVEPPSPKSLKYQAMREEYQKSDQSLTGLSIGEGTPRSGRRSGRNYITPEEENERRAKMEKQRKYAQDIAAGAKMAPIENTRKQHSGRGRRQREPLPDETPMFSEEKQAINKKLAQQQYFRQLQEAQSQQPIQESRVPLRRNGRDNRESERGGDASFEHNRQGNGPENRHTEDQMHQDALQLAREKMRKLREEAERQDAEDQAEAERRYALMKQQQEGFQRRDQNRDSYEDADAERRYAQMMKEQQDAEDQAEAERRYFQMKMEREQEMESQQHRPTESADRHNAGVVNGSTEPYRKGMDNPVGESRNYYGDDSISPRASKFYSGGGADRTGYRATAQDYSYAHDSSIHSSTSADQYVHHQSKRHSVDPHSRSQGIVGDFSQYPDNPPKSNHMRSVLSVGYNDPGIVDSAGDGRMNSGRLSGRKSEYSYGDEGNNAGGGQEGVDSRSLKRMQQQQYREEVARAAAAVPVEYERAAKFRQEAREAAQGINLPGNNGMYGAAGYSDPHSHQSKHGNYTTGYRSRGNSRDSSKFVLG